MIRVRSSPFVSRGGEKLAAALDHFSLNVAGWVCADLGSHIGGFVDCLLQRGAARVFAVDTCYGTLAWKLRRDRRVVVMERTNAMHVALPEPVDLVTVDVGWTPQVQVLPNVVRMIGPRGNAAHRVGRVIDPTGSVRGTHRDADSKAGYVPESPLPLTSPPGNLDRTASECPRYTTGLVITLIKPHYEAHRLAQIRGRAERDKETGTAPQTAGVPGLVDGVLSNDAFEPVVEDVLDEIRSSGWQVDGVFESPIRGHAGNREVFALLTRSKSE